MSRPVLEMPVAVRLGSACLAAAVILGLTGCSGADEDLAAWEAQQRNEVRPKVQPLDPPGRFDPRSYLVQQKPDPFSADKLIAALKQDGVSNNPVILAQLARRREPLELYPLDALTMVGSITRGGQTFALISAERLIYKVSTGEHLGMNFGKVTRITDDFVELLEYTQDAAGEWSQRTTRMELQEKAR